MSLDSSTDLGALTRVVYGEARGESDEGRRGVAWTVKNRSKKSGKSIQEEATKKYQFCCYSGEMKETKARDECKKVAQDTIDGSNTDPTGGATFFYSGKKVPSWAEGKKPCKTIGGHKFFKDISPY
jgi:spore germination cell wall hydrolase CwlJ-like protein